MAPSRFSRELFGGDEAAADRALSTHERQLTPGTSVRVYRGRAVGLVGIIVGARGGRRYAVEGSDGLTWEVESRNLEVLS